MVHIASERSVIEIVFSRLTRQPDKCCLLCGEQAISAGQLAHKAVELAGKLAGAGLGHGQRIGVLMERGPDALCLLLALWRLGAVYVPLDPALPRERLLSLCEDARPALVVIQAQLRGNYDYLPCRQLFLAPVSFADAPPGAPAAGAAPWPAGAGLSAYILYTSGSTGHPKGVEISHASLYHLLGNVLPLLGLGSDEVFLGLAGFSFDIAFFELLAPLMLGATLVLLDRDEHRDPHAIAQAIDAHGATVVQATPSLWRLLQDLCWNPAGRPLLAISTGEALPASLAQALLRRCATLWNLYGPTECTIWACGRRLDAGQSVPARDGLVPIGTALPGYRLRLAPPNDDAPPGAAREGELMIAGPGLALGYFGAPELTRRAFPQAGPRQDRHYHSGDRCGLDECGELHYLGRLDNQIKLNGHRIELEEIELALESHGVIRQALVRPVKLGREQVEVLAAFVVHESGMPNKTAATLNRYLSLKLPHHMLPERYQFVDSLPMTLTGKKDRQAAPALLDQAAGSARGPLPRSPLEQSVAEVFRQILDQRELGLYDSFFDAGGNSMLAATLLLSINQRFATRITLRQLLLTPPTVQNVSARLAALGLDQAQTRTAPA